MMSDDECELLSDVSLAAVISTNVTRLLPVSDNNRSTSPGANLRTSIGV